RGPEPRPNPVQRAEAARARRSVMLRRAAGLESWAPPETPLRFDALAYDLDLRFDFERQRVAGVVTLSVEALEDGLDRLELDADAGLRIGAVWIEEDGGFPADPPGPLAHTHAGDRLSIALRRRFSRGERLRLGIAYAGRASRLEDGVTWTTLGESTPSATTMAEPFGARVWVPCQDRPDDKALWTLRITAPEDLQVGANGTRLSREDNGDGTVTTTWSSVYPIATYLVVVDISDYRIIEDHYTGLDRTASMPVETWAYPWNEATARSKFSSTPKLLRLLASHFGEYPFLAEKYGNCLASIWAGGMEHQTFTSVAGGTGPEDNGVLDQRSVRYLDVHEAAHQWWGDWVSPATWKDLWLNESFASYAELLLAESDGQLESYLDSGDWRGWFAGPLYDNPEAFSITIYTKGARVLRMLEGLLGRRDFEAALARWRELRGGRSGDTAQFQKAVEEISGGGLSWFFGQWVYGSGRPHLRWSWERADGPAVRLRVDQVQRNTGLFRFPMEVAVGTASGEEIHTVEVQAAASQAFEIPVSAEPGSVVLDPGNRLLKEQHTASEPDLDLGPAFEGRAAFPPVVLGATATAELMVSNLGGSTLSLTGSQAYDVNAWVDLPGGRIDLEPGGSARLALRLKPGERGAAHGWLTLRTNDPAGNGRTWIEVSGVGAERQGPAIRAPGSVRWTRAVPAGSASERLVVVSNTGTEPVHLLATVEGTGFSLPGATALDMDPGAEAALVLRFAPVGEGAFSGRLDLAPGGATPVTVILEGEGVAAGRIAAEPGVALFGIVAPHEAARGTLRLVNRGGAALVLSELSLDAPFSLGGGPRLPARLDPGAAVELGIELEPSGVGVKRAVLRVVSDDPETPLLVVPMRAVVRQGRRSGRVSAPSWRGVPAGISSSVRPPTWPGSPQGGAPPPGSR
ncbi:MAG: choice-of-anchor D domain-containing protein, partial [Acidobacteria bacterium]|nr:choice-of-anchor D domain-containing protein [Acidobacteriota bacterium]